MIHFEHAVAATRGARDNQEDTAAVWPNGDDPFSAPAAASSPSRGEPLYAVLADGMGGHAGGALASRTVCEAFLATVPRSTGSNPDRLTAGLEAANLALATKVLNNPLLSGMGSTLIGAVFSSDGLEWVSVGDSPLYLVRGGEARILNEDHSLAPELDYLVAKGRLTEQEALRDPRRHMLRSAVTGDEIDMIDLTRVPFELVPGDVVVLASDGVDTLEPEDLSRIVAKHSDESPEAVARALIRAIDAAREPHQDNATVVVVRVEG